MAIHLIRHDDAARGLPAAVLGQLSGRAADAGHLVLLQHCDGEYAVLRALERAEREGAEAILLDPGMLCGACLRARAVRSRVPLIEVHDDGAAPTEPSLHEGAIHGYGAQGYVLALELVLESIDCARCAGDVHVGT